MRLVGLLFAFAVAAVVVLMTSCGGDGDSGKKTPSVLAGTPVSDADYLGMICRGSNDFIVAINSNPDVNAIRKVVESWKQEVEQTTPPDDLRDWQADFVAYLGVVAGEPTKGLTQSPPLPPDDIRQRLVSHRSEVPDCQGRTFLDPSPTAAP